MTEVPQSDAAADKLRKRARELRRQAGSIRIDVSLTPVVTPTGDVGLAAVGRF